MANAVRGQVRARVSPRPAAATQVGARAGGVDLVLEFSVDALCQLEDRLDESVVAIAGRIGQNDRLAFLRVILWAALLENQVDPATGRPAYDERAAGELLRGDGGPTLRTKLLAAFTAAFPNPEAAQDGAPGPRKGPRRPAGTGLDS